MTEGPRKELIEFLTESFYSDQRNNHDWLRFAASPTRQPRSIRGALFLLLQRASRRLSRKHVIWLEKQHMRRVLSEYMEIAGMWRELEATYQLLGNDLSRQWMVWLLAYRILGYRKVKLPTNNDMYWSMIHKIETQLLRQRDVFDTEGYLDKLSEYDLRAVGFPVQLVSHPIYVLATFMLQQYAYHGPNRESVEAKLGDIVLDGGACWGDTALYFADRIGSAGKVYSFEFSPANIKVLNENLRLNALLAERVELVELALWEKSDSLMQIHEHGPATKLTGSFLKDVPGSAQTISIDDFVERRRLRRIDFIKLDVEGAELPVLKGAENVLRRFRPALAIAVYHNLNDLVTIPRYLSSLNLGYNFYLGHYTIHQEETILFASSDHKNQAAISK